jgi:hypothetical protein
MRLSFRQHVLTEFEPNLLGTVAEALHSACHEGTNFSIENFEEIFKTTEASAFAKVWCGKDAEIHSTLDLNVNIVTSYHSHHKTFETL